MTKPRTIGNMIAPWRFIVFFVALVIGGGVGIRLFHDDWLGLMAGFDVAASIFLLLSLPLLAIEDATVIERAAKENDGNRKLLLAVTGIVMAILLIAVAAETVGHRPEPFTKITIIATLVLAWLFSNSVYALHYAHLAYVDPEKGCKGLDFPATRLPLYWDFAYFAFTLGMTFQTSDVTISSPHIRRIVTIHSLAAFFFNIGVLAFTINVLGSN
jgi:uncharacterized membrane protein